MIEDHPRRIIRSAFSFLTGTLLSRFTGLLRDVSMAFCFGSSPAIAAFMIAFRFSHLLRRLLGEGSLSSGVIPHFETLRKEAPREGALFFSTLFRCIALFVLGTVCLVEGVLYFLLKSGVLSYEGQEVLLFTMWMLPGMLFICLFGLSNALLQCEKYFFLTGVAPIAFNCVWILAIFFLKDLSPTQAAQGLSIAVVLALCGQWLMVAPKMFSLLRKALSWKECFFGKVFTPELGAVLKPFLLSLVGVSAVQINSALDALFARAASLEGPAYLWYAIRMEQLPLALVGVALSSALLPALSRAFQGGNLSLYCQQLRFAFQRSLSVMLPASMAILVLGLSSVNLLYGRGEFHTQACLETTYCLWGYGVGLVPSVFVLTLASAFYAQKDFITPMRGTLFSVALNLLLNAVQVFMLGWGPFSIALSTSLCAFFNCLYLIYHLQKKRILVLDLSFWMHGLKILFCVSVAGVATLFLGHHLVGDPTLHLLLGKPLLYLHLPREFFEQILRFAALGGTFALIVLSYAWLFLNEAKGEEKLET